MRTRTLGTKGTMLAHAAARARGAVYALSYASHKAKSVYTFLLKSDNLCHLPGQGDVATSMVNSVYDQYSLGAAFCHTFIV